MLKKGSPFFRSNRRLHSLDAYFIVTAFNNCCRHLLGRESSIFSSKIQEFPTASEFTTFPYPTDYDTMLGMEEIDFLNWHRCIPHSFVRPGLFYCDDEAISMRDNRETGCLPTFCVRFRLVENYYFHRSGSASRRPHEIERMSEYLSVGRRRKKQNKFGRRLNYERFRVIGSK